MSPVIPPHLARLVLVRHGEAEGNRELRYLGDLDAPLTQRGSQQAAQVAAAVAGFGIAAVYTSPRTRALQTASVIAGACGCELQVVPGLRELSYGEWEGMLHAEVAARHPELMRQWEADPATAPPGGESLLTMSARVVACADSLAQRHGGVCIALVSHVGPIKALVCHVLGLDVEGTRRTWLDPAAISILDWPLTPEASGTLRLFNSFHHLDGGVRWLRD